MKRKMFSYFKFIIILIGLSTLGTIMILFKSAQTDYNNALMPTHLDFFEIKGNITASEERRDKIECYDLAQQKNSRIECLENNNNIYVRFDYFRKKFDVRRHALIYFSFL